MSERSKQVLLHSLKGEGNDKRYLSMETVLRRYRDWAERWLRAD